MGSSGLDPIPLSIDEWAFSSLPLLLLQLLEYSPEKERLCCPDVIFPADVNILITDGD